MTQTAGSLPSQGAWIEIRSRCVFCRLLSSLPSQGAWIEMCRRTDGGRMPLGRSLHRERGLKSCGRVPRAVVRGSLPSQGAWIEISTRKPDASQSGLSLPSQGAWIEMGNEAMYKKLIKRRSLHRERGLKLPSLRRHGAYMTSLPSQGAWIEIWMRAT